MGDGAGADANFSIFDRSESFKARVADAENLDGMLC